MTFPSLKQSRGLLVVSYLQSPAGHRQKNNQVNPAEQSRAFASSWLSPSLLCTARVNQAALHEAALPWEGGGGPNDALEKKMSSQLFTDLWGFL